uniref:Uncharacterized protein n=1 Tax=Lactuca sativa TaxID=4236 RepID=A0A9R1X870_LACSA|nr:hypothetical protein LSAT_V11C600304200 [Lactuca sativa]
MSHKEFVGFLERFTQEKCKKLYYCMSDLEIPEGLALISNEGEYQKFIEIAYQVRVQVLVYMDHFGTNLQVFSTGVSKENEIEDNCSVMSNMSMEMEDGVNLTEFMSPRKSNMEGVPYDGVNSGKWKWGCHRS